MQSLIANNTEYLLCVRHFSKWYLGNDSSLRQLYEVATTIIYYYYYYPYLINGKP